MEAPSFSDLRSLIRTMDLPTESSSSAANENEQDSLFEGGFDKDMFLDISISEKLICPLCEKVLRHNEQRKCGHAFCKTCLRKLKQSTIEQPEPIYCPACVRVDDVIPDSRIAHDEVNDFDYSAKRELSGKLVRCRHFGCTYTGQLDDYVSHHEMTCAKARVPCPNQCGEHVHFALMAKHRNTTCKRRPSFCPDCGETYLLEEENDHKKKCVNRKIDCELCAAKDFNTNTLKAHRKNDCPYFECPIGCGGDGTDNAKAIIPRKDVDDHFAKGITPHMIKIGEELQCVRAEIVRLSGLAQQRNLATETKRAHHPDDILTAMNDQVESLDNICTVYKTEIEKLFDASFYNNQRFDQLANVVREMGETINSLQQSVQLKDVQLMERDLRIKALEDTSYDGSLVWRVENFSDLRNKAKSGEQTSIYSPEFYTSRCGYKMCARLYLNGDGIGKGTHVSYFFVLMRGKYDAMLRWPFSQKVTMMLLDYTAEHHVMDAFRPDKESESFSKPKLEMNTASGCPLFMPLSNLNEKVKNYVRDDVAYFKIIVDCSDIPY